jgi:hypothetical protein
MQLEGKAGFSISEACDAARISRAGFYRHFDDHAPQQSATELLPRNSTDLLEQPLLRLPAGYGSSTRPRPNSESQACTAIDAQRQFALPA